MRWFPSFRTVAPVSRLVWNHHWQAWFLRWGRGFDVLAVVLLPPYICISNYPGTYRIWRKTAMSSFWQPHLIWTSGLGGNLKMLEIRWKVLPSSTGDLFDCAHDVCYLEQERAIKPSCRYRYINVGEKLQRKFDKNYNKTSYPFLFARISYSVESTLVLMEIRDSDSWLAG